MHDSWKGGTIQEWGINNIHGILVTVRIRVFAVVHVITESSPNETVARCIHLLYRDSSQDVLLGL